MSPRAAWRLESLGFTAVYDYAAGKSDWTASGLPTEGAYAHMPRAGMLAERGVPICGLDDALEDVAKGFADVGTDECVVTNGDGIVFGRIRREWLGEGDGVAAVMEPGPTTVRYDEFLPDLVERMQEAKVESIIVTTPTGRLVGMMWRGDAEEVLEQLRREHEHEHGETG